MSRDTAINKKAKGAKTVKKSLVHFVLAMTMLLGVGQALDGPTMPPPPLPGIAA